MSYSIIFETKILRLSDGRVIHFDRSGCNNDGAGRRKDEFTATIYSDEDFITRANTFALVNPVDDIPNALKIGSRWVSTRGYGEHLLRMYHRGNNFFEFMAKYVLEATVCVGVQVAEPVTKTMTPEEFSDKFYDFLSIGNLRYSKLIEWPAIDSEETLIKLIESYRGRINFEIRKKK